MSFTIVTVNLDAVTEDTVANATGPVLFHLAKQLAEEVLRLLAHVQLADAALGEAHRAPQNIQDTLGADIAAARERLERLQPLAEQACRKFAAEAREYFGHRRCRLPAIDLLSNDDEWDVLSHAVSALDLDHWSSLEAETEPESLFADTAIIDRSNSSFDLIDFADDDTICGGSSTEDERRPVSRPRPATPMPRTQSSSARAQPHEFGEPPASSSRTASAAPRRRQNLGVPIGWEDPPPTPWDPLSAVQPASTSVSATGSSPAPARMRQPQRVVPSSTAVPPAPSSPPAPTAAEAAVDAMYDALDYDGQIFGYVGGNPVPMVPVAIQDLMPEELEALDKVILWHRLKAHIALDDAREQLRSLPASEDDAIMALALKISALEAALVKADKLAIVSEREQLSRRPARGIYIYEPV